jgi:UDP-N-acetylglucosamine--N-acetylmuramyl-(pentapeptide) pyrophosphoryl-undecaprenol N-acetylglucosamine transferase
MRVILSGGGTGGHIYPALALAKQIQEQKPNAEILYIGSGKGLEADIVSKAGYNFKAIEISGFKRSLSIENIRTVLRFIRAVSDSKRYIADFKADVVIGTGGYVCGPVVYAASKLKIPTIIHEQNVIPGLTNKFLSRYAKRIAVSFTGSAGYFPNGKVIVTGNPRATEVAKADPIKGRTSLKVSRDRKIVLVVGGSRGARPINEAFLAAIPLLKQMKDLHFVYVTGEVHYPKVKETMEAMEQPAQNVSIYPFIYNMPEVLAATDLIVNRAGASFLAEITSLGIPSILIPSPYVTNNHQEKNARWLEDNGASKVLLESELDAGSLALAIQAILYDPDCSGKMRKAALQLGQPAAAQNLYDEMIKLVNR